MPVRINLLPKYVLLKKYFQWALISCIGLFAVWVVALALIYADTQVQLRVLNTSLANVEPAAEATQAAQTAKSTADSAKAPLDADIKFMLAASQTGAQRASLLDTFYHYIFYPGSVVSQIDLTDGKNAVIKAMVKTPDDYARFITILRQGTAPTGTLFADLPIGTNGVPGFPKLKTETTTDTTQNSSTNLSMVVFPLTVEAKGVLLYPVTIPAAPGAAGAAPTDAGGAPGMGAPIPGPAPGPAPGGGAGSDDQGN